jgi:hypothetical protein
LHSLTDVIQPWVISPQFRFCKWHQRGTRGADLADLLFEAAIDNEEDLGLFGVRGNRQAASTSSERQTSTRVSTLHAEACATVDNKEHLGLFGTARFWGLSTASI